MPQEGLKFIDILKSVTEMAGGHYQVPLPFRKDEINLPNNLFHKQRRDLPAWRENCQQILNSNNIT